MSRNVFTKENLHACKSLELTSTFFAYFLRDESYHTRSEFYIFETQSEHCRDLAAFRTHETSVHSPTVLDLQSFSALGL